MGNKKPLAKQNVFITDWLSWQPVRNEKNNNFKTNQILSSHFKLKTSELTHVNIMFINNIS